jgi:hypothetical protein
MAEHKYCEIPTKPLSCIICGSGRNESHCAKCSKWAEKLYDSESYADGQKLCWPCKDWEVGQLIARVDKTAEQNALIKDAISTKELVFSSDIFNNKMQTIIDLKKSIDSDETITDKELAFQNAIFERYKHFKAIAFDANNELLALGRQIREFGEATRNEIRSKIVEHDASYQPEKPKIPVKVKGAPKLTPFDRMVQQFATASGKSFEEAKKILEHNMAPKEN